MAFPDRIERTVEIAHPPPKVWAALTTAEGLSAWFGSEAGIDLRPGGTATRLTVVESGFAQLAGDAHRTAYDGNTRGWASELGELASYLDAA